MKKSIVLLATLVVLTALLITACGAPTPTTTVPPITVTPTPTASPTSSPTPTVKPTTPTTTAPVKPIVLNFNTQTPGPAQKANYDAAEWVASEIAKRTNGRVKIQNFYNNALTSGTGGWDATVSGVVDIDESVVGYFPGQFPFMSIAELPVGYPSSFAIANASMDFANKYAQAQAEFSKVKLLYFACPPGFTVGTTKKEIKTNADAKGLTLRTHAGSAPIATALGATPKITPIPEAYELLSKGVVDGLIVAPEAYPGYKFDELVKFQYEVFAVSSTSCSFIIMNKDSLARLQPQDQQALLDIYKAVLPARAAEWDKLNNTALDAWLKLPGRVYNKPSADDVAKMKAALQPTVDAWVKKANSLGAPGDEMLKYMQERIDYWSKQTPAAAPWAK